MTSLRPTPVRRRLATAARLTGGAGILAAGLLAASAFTSSAPAAPQDCLPVVGCVTTTLPTVSLPGVTLPTVPVLVTSTSLVAPPTIVSCAVAFLRLIWPQAGLQSIALTATPLGSVSVT